MKALLVEGTKYLIPWQPHRKVNSFFLIFKGIWQCEEMVKLLDLIGGLGAKRRPHISFL